jgi:hypothetical protein
MAQIQRIPGTAAAYVTLAMTALVIGGAIAGVAWLVIERLP